MPLLLLLGRESRLTQMTYPSGAWPDGPCGDGASAGWDVIVGSAFEAPALISSFDDVAVVGQAIEQRGRHLGITEATSHFLDTTAFIVSATSVPEHLRGSWHATI